MLKIKNETQYATVEAIIRIFSNRQILGNKVIYKDNKIVLREDHLLDEDFFSEMKDYFIKRDVIGSKTEFIISDYIENVLFCDQRKRKVMWVLSEGKQKLSFSGTCGLTSVYFLPTILFVHKDKETYVYAYNGKYIYELPLPNIYKDNKICFGNVPENEESELDKFINKEQDRFLCSQFTEWHNDDSKNVWETKASIVPDSKKYDYRILTKTDLTLSELW